MTKNPQSHPPTHTRKRQIHNPMGPQQHTNPPAQTLPNPTTPHMEHSPMITTQPTRNPSPPTTRPHQLNPHNHTKSTLTIDTYQPPEPTKPQHRMARPIITPVKPQSKANTHPNELLQQQVQRDRRVTQSPLPRLVPTTNPPNATKVTQVKNGSLNETEPNPPTTIHKSTNKKQEHPPPHSTGL